MTVIYKISCGDNIYVGQTNNLKRRTLEHKHRAFKASWDNKLYQAIRKQGYFEIDEIDVCDNHLAHKLEQFWIFKLKPNLNTNYAFGKDLEKEKARRQRFWDKKRYCRFCDVNIPAPNWWRHCRSDKHSHNCMKFCQPILLSKQ